MWKQGYIAVMDTETTGLDVGYSHVWELAVVTVQGTQVFDGVCERFNPGIKTLHPKITEITGVTIDDLRSYQPFTEYAERFKIFIEQHQFYAAYNVPFDRPFIHKLFASAGLTLEERPWIDVLVWVKEFQKYQKGKKLAQAASRLGITLDNAHNALADATATAHVLTKYIDKFPDDTQAFLNVQAMQNMSQQRDYDDWKKAQAMKAAQNAQS